MIGQIKTFVLEEALEKYLAAHKVRTILFLLLNAIKQHQ